MNISVTYVIDYHYLDVRQYLDDILYDMYVPRVYLVPSLSSATTMSGQNLESSCYSSDDEESAKAV